MVYFTLYVLALCSPLVVFAVISIVDDRKKAPKPRRASRHHRPLTRASDALIAVLEAQFLVAPGLAVREAQRLLCDATGEPEAPVEPQISQQSFERLLDRLTKAGRTRHLLSAR
jgi:hypothetical protein